MNLKETTIADLNKYSCKINNPNESEDYQFCIKAYALRMKEHYDESIKLYQEALKIDKDNLEALKGIALCYQKKEQYHEAIKYYNSINAWYIKCTLL